MLFGKNELRRRPRRSDISAMTASVIELLEARTLLASTPVGVETLVNPSTNGTQAVGAGDGRSVAVASDNSYVTVWTSSLGDGSGYGVYARRFAADGLALSGQILVNTTTVNDQSEPAVAVAADGRFVVAWQSQTQDGSGLAVIARQFAANGTPLSGELIVNTTTAGDQQTPAVAFLSGGGFVVTWSGQGIGDITGVFGRVSNAAGTAFIGSEFRVNQSTGLAQTHQSVASDGAGGFAVAWQGSGAGDASGVFVRRFNSLGVATSNETRVNQTISGNQQFPSIATRSDGSFVVAWNGNGAGDINGVFARRISSAGATVGSEILVNQTISGTQQTPSVTASGTGFTVAWQGTGATDGIGIFFREFDSVGTALGNEKRVNSSVAGIQKSPTVAAMNGGLVIAWSGEGAADTTGVFIQRYTNYNFVVNSFADTVDANPGDGIAADANGNVTLRAAIMEANAKQYPVPVVITLRPGSYNLSIAGKGEDAGARGDLDVLSKIEIVGAGAAVTTVNGKSLDRVFQVLPNASLSLRRLKVAGGDATNSGSLGGGGVLSDHASLFIADSIIAGNRAMSDADNYGGGGVEVNDGTAFIRNTTFTGNVAHRLTPSPTLIDSAAYGAGLYAEGANVDILNSTFTNNSGHEGGAIANIGGSVMSITGTTIRGNSTDHEGGGIQNELSILDIANSTISNNRATDTGGGLFNYAGIINISETGFTGNSTGGFGGAIQNTGRITAAIGTITLSRSTFSGNSAKDGGAISNARDSVLRVNDSTITSNSASEAGGGVVNASVGNFGAGTVTILRSLISNNSSVYGGGVFALKNATNIQDSTISNNTSTGGGGGVMNTTGGTMSISGSQITGNTSSNGGGIENDLSRLTLTNTNVSDNDATRDGGGLFNFAGVVGIAGSKFTGNTAGSEGGGIENTGRITAAIGTMNIANTTVSGNSADIGGGVDNKRDSVMSITDSVVLGNLATTEGGGIANQNIESFGPGHLTLKRVTVANNTSQLYGGGVYAEKNVTDITDSTFTSNTAHEGGGIDNVGGAVMRVVHTSFTGNSTNHEGGTVQNELSSLTVSNSSFTNNQTAGDGGGIFNFAGVVVISGSTFTGNSAGNQGGAIENTGRITAAIGTMTISNTTVSGNSADKGGGIDNRRDSVMTITDSRVTGNSATTEGGGISNQNTESFGPGHLTLLRVTVSNNATPLYGGGLYAEKNTTDITDSTFTGNTANQGGAIGNVEGAVMRVVHTSVASNSTSHEGGGIQNELSSLTVINSSVTNNLSTGDGGGIFNFAGVVGISGSTFTGNVAGSEGGAIENTGRVTAAIGTMTITSTFVSGNSADKGGGLDNKRDSVMTVTDSSITSNSATTGGGGISNQNTENFGPGHLTLLRVTVANNSTSHYGGGLFVSKNTTDITDSIFIGNQANEGGAIDNVDAAVMHISGTRFTGNSTDHEGGGVQNELSTLTVTNSSFENNHSADIGGGIYNFAGVVAISGSTFMGNSTGSGGGAGGAIMNSGRITAAIGTMDISNSTFSGNSANDGGAIANRRDSVMTITDSTISGNSATGLGGGVSNKNTDPFGPGTLTILRSTISSNSSSAGGGVMTLKNITKIIDSTISNNTATFSGGGVENLTGGTTSLINATVAYNTAGHGGGLYTDSGVFNVSNTIVAKNTATTINPDAEGTFVSGGHVLIGIVGTASGFTNGVNGDLVGTAGSPVDPLLGTLQNNGGPTQTIALLVGSPAIDQGDNTVATSAGLTVDQRKLNRFIHGVVDIGAYELGA